MIFTFTDSERNIFRLKERDENGNPLTVSKHAELYREVVTGPAKGRWRNSFTPYLREVMDSFNKPYVREIYLMFSPQTGKTSFAINCIHYIVDQSPGPICYVMPNEMVGRRIMKRQILPALKSSNRVSALISDRADDVTSSRILFKNGADINIVWATSPASIASESYQIVIMDEPGKYPEFSGREADPFSLLRERMNSFPFTSKLLAFSTPTDDSNIFTREMTANIEVLYEYHVPCPACGKFQFMDFSRFIWPEKTDHRKIRKEKLARYACENCKMEWDDHIKTSAVDRGIWVPDREVERPAAIGFHLPKWYYPTTSMSLPVSNYIKGKNDRTKMMAHVTQDRALPWKDAAENQSEAQILRHKCDVPRGIVPSEVLALTAGIDVQQSGFWYVVRGWAADFSSWLIDYGYLSTWKDLDFLLFNTKYQRHGADGDGLTIWRAAIDTGGGKSASDDWSRTEEIYAWLRKSAGYGIVYGIKGASQQQFKRVSLRILDKMTTKNRVIPGGLELRLLDTNQFKEIFHFRLNYKELNHNQRFFLHSDTGVDYAKQVMAERKGRDRRGKRSWLTTGENHLMDCEVYAAACVDAEWQPSFAMIARYLTAQKENPASVQEKKKKPESTGKTSKSRW